MKIHIESMLKISNLYVVDVLLVRDLAQLRWIIVYSN